MNAANVDWTSEVDGATFDEAVVAMARIAGSVSPGSVLDVTGDHWIDGVKAR